MVEAFVLINCGVGKKKQVVEHLSALKPVKEVQATFGFYDVIARLESDTKEALDEAIKSKILKLQTVNCVLTLETN